MKKLLEILENKRTYLLSLFVLRKQYRLTVNANSSDLDQLISKTYHTYNSMRHHISQYKRLMSIKDSLLSIYNSNLRIKFIYDPFYCHSSEDERLLLLSRLINENKYFSINKKNDIINIGNEEITKPKRSFHNNIRVHCYSCGLETSYDYFEDDGSPKLCKYCHLGIERPYLTKLEKYFNS